MLARVARLERARTAPRSFFEHAYGSLAAFEEDVQALIDAGSLCPLEMPLILRSIRRWHDEGVFGAWQHDRIWEYGG
jgi:hypothetical protein